MSITKRLRFEILSRDGFACRYCGAKAPDATLVVDHVTPKALGGTDEPTNLVTACRDCNTGKSSVSPSAATVADVDQDAIEWASRVRDVLAQMRVNRTAAHNEVAEFGSWWRTFGEPIGMDDVLPWDYGDSIRGFLARGLTMADLKWFAEDVMLNPKVHRSGVWRYFCGVCWRTLDEAISKAKDAQ
jgi:DNA-directed RNA polymerase subunit RPC12/RpoP